MVEHFREFNFKGKLNIPYLFPEQATGKPYCHLQKYQCQNLP